MWMLFKTSYRKRLNFSSFLSHHKKSQSTSKLICRRTVFPDFTATKDFMLRSLNFGLTVCRKRFKKKKYQCIHLYIHVYIDSKVFLDGSIHLDINIINVQNRKDKKRKGSLLFLYNYGYRRGGPELLQLSSLCGQT